ncbi:siderophore-interacting protein [Phyllobacterium myrsinacearum]|uniref:NADPH-dependent ferric siderophore reductase n=1 Tax=Phyllobacterium myrsinacearum TaxID=28101 RepID=A0A839EPR7_9HYPH|nr:siderophore-interacting protein [Phyllobacterium myrsinacearum]MBA8879416.1 NADPH-dependent ferric siderophore reductase [Phyllobacterium myrsinacearum]
MSAMSNVLSSSAAVKLHAPQDMLDKLCNVFAEHARVERDDLQGRIEMYYGKAHLTIAGDVLSMDVEADDETSLAYVRMVLADNLLTFAGEEKPQLSWMGDGLTSTDLPYFREMRVVSAYDLTPHMRRVRLRGENLARFAVGGLHIRLLFVSEGRKPVWPTMGRDGRPVWPDGEDALIARVYTIRNIDVNSGEVDIDMVVHPGNDTPGATWALNAKPGDIVGMTGPGGGGVLDAPQHLLVGDETALPAIGRILEALPSDAKATVILEVDGPADQLALKSPASIDVHWHYRLGAPAGTTGRLAEMIQTLDSSVLSSDTFVWVGCEFADFKQIRAYLRKERKHERSKHHVVAYWRRGFDGDNARQSD